MLGCCAKTLLNLGLSKRLSTSCLFWPYNGFIKPEKESVVFLMLLHPVLGYPLRFCWQVVGAILPGVQNARSVPGEQFGALSCIQLILFWNHCLSCDLCLVMGEFSSELQFEPNPSWTEWKVQFQVQQNGWTELMVRFQVQSLGRCPECVQTCSNQIELVTGAAVAGRCQCWWYLHRQQEDWQKRPDHHRCHVTAPSPLQQCYSLHPSFP